MIKCVVIDDEQPAIDVLTQYIHKVPQLELAGTATNPLEGIDMVNRLKPELVLLDIQMDEMNGLDVMKAIDKKTKVIFCTAYSEFAITAFELEAVDYLMKPVPFARFMKAIQRAINQLVGDSVKEMEAIPNDYLFVKTEQKGKLLKVNFDDIDYIEGQKNYVAFHRSRDKVMALLNMKDLEDRLPKNQFMRVHKSFIVPFRNIVAIEGNTLVLKNRSERITIGETYRDVLTEKMKRNLMV
ncbi:MAG: LytTR family DNA-binding domain-containing protein [Chitinophagaceae bacterium]